ncbi:MAG TPA: polysaccharide biosynthesis/export family protein [Cyclobacteriaceae bacterium]|jgi:polysaccharide export outer membrane protein|nr:polysaccharide biosynthesis/export family protein [Cyclobacteriaceae bacterium]
MRKAHLLIFLAALLALSSCVTNKKILYLQKEGDLKKKKNPPDTATRDYDLVDFKYKVQTNDIISVRYQSLTQKEFDFTQQNTQQNSGGNTIVGGALLLGDVVDENGEIPVPVVGRVKVAGLTIFQIQDTIQQIANHYLEGPVVRVRLLNYRSTILGEVNKEGAITYNNNRVSLMEAIGLAGGLTDLADRSNVKLIRQTGSKTEVHYVNLLQEDFISSPYYYVYQNDLIIVPPLKQRPFRKYFFQNLTILLSVATVLLIINTYSK